MRPTDEDQPASTRPHLMSAGRRFPAGGDNVLSRLERDAKRGKAAKGGHAWMSARLAWSALAGVAVVGLIGVLASLAQENLAVHRQPALSASPPELLASEPHSSPSIEGAFASLPEPALSRGAAAIVDEQITAPPLVMLKDEDEAYAKPASARVPKHAAKAGRAPAASASVQPLAAAAMARPRHAMPARARKPAPAAVAEVAESPADSDVALLSAIIMHASRHADERAQMEAATRCPAGKKCALPSNLKATD